VGQDSPLFGCSQEAADEVDDEEKEWVMRKMKTGAVCRMAFYRSGGQEPIEDILGLRWTKTGPLKVSALLPGGTASQYGVEVGDQVVTINGREPYEGLLAEAIRMRLQAPVVIIFTGFVGKLQAEVRVRQPDSPVCGFPATTDVAAALLSDSDHMAVGEKIILRDPVVFQQAPTSLFLAVPTIPNDSTACSEDGGETVQLAAIGSTETEWSRAHNVADCAPNVSEGPASKEARSCCKPGKYSQADKSLPRCEHAHVYELQRREARRLVTRALWNRSTGV